MTTLPALRACLLRHLLALLALMALLGVVAPPAGAHAGMVRSDPPDGGMVAVGRSALTLWFGEPVNPRASTFRLQTTDGLGLELTVVSVEGETVSLETSPLALGTYTLDWHAMSLEDGHAATGRIVFGAGVRPTVLETWGTDLPPAGHTAVRWLDLAGLLLAVGAFAVARPVRDAGGAAGRRLGRLALLGIGASLLAGAVTPFLRTYQGGVQVGEWWGQTSLTLTATPWGTLWLLRMGVLVAALVATWFWSRGEGARARATAVASLAAACALQSWAGHAGALDDEVLLAVLMATGHVLAAGVWAGGLVTLVVAAPPRAHPGLVRTVWHAWSPRAAIASVVLVATGVYQAGRHVPAPSDLADTAYGVGVSLKVALLTTALVLAGLNTLVVNPRLVSSASRLVGVRPPVLRPAGFARTLAAEAVVLAVAVLAGALVAALPTAREVARADTRTAPYAETVDGLFVTFEAVPSGSGRTRLIVRVRATTRPQPAPLSGADVSLTGPDGNADVVALTEVEAGRYEGDSRAHGPGPYQADVLVHRTGLPDSVVSTTWEMSEGREGGPWRTASSVLAGVLLAGLVLVLGLLIRRRRDPGDPIDPVDPVDRAARTERPLEEVHR